MADIIKIENLTKIYNKQITALKNINLRVQKEDFIVILGPSGAGKSTLLRSINRLINPTCGKIWIAGTDICSLKGKKLRKVRKNIGMIFQQFNLSKRLSTLENVIAGSLGDIETFWNFYASIFKYYSQKEIKKALENLKKVGIANLASKRVDQLSGGQQQRVAIARSLMQNPCIFLADEPVASLDPASSEVVLSQLKQIHLEKKIPIIINLHQVSLAKRYAKRIIGMRQGEIVFDGKPQELNTQIIENIYGVLVNPRTLKPLINTESFINKAIPINQRNTNQLEFSI